MSEGLKLTLALLGVVPTAWVGYRAGRIAAYLVWSAWRVTHPLSLHERIPNSDLRLSKGAPAPR